MRGSKLHFSNRDLKISSLPLNFAIIGGFQRKVVIFRQKFLDEKKIFRQFFDSPIFFGGGADICHDVTVDRD